MKVIVSAISNIRSFISKLRDGKKARRKLVYKGKVLLVLVGLTYFQVQEGSFGLRLASYDDGGGDGEGNEIGRETREMLFS